MNGDMNQYYVEPRWWAVLTQCRHEKAVNRFLQNTGIESFLPLYRSTRRWNTRPARVDFPLFPCYLFVRIPLAERLRVLTAPGVFRLVGTGDQPTPLEDQEVKGIRNYLEADLPAEPFDAPAAGERVCILSGPLAGLTGTLLRHRGRTRAVIEIQLLMKSIIVDVDQCELARMEGEPGGAVLPAWRKASASGVAPAT